MLHSSKQRSVDLYFLFSNGMQILYINEESSWKMQHLKTFIIIIIQRNLRERKGFYLIYVHILIILNDKVHGLSNTN